MIRLVTEENAPLFLQAAELEPVSGARAWTLYHMFGIGKYADFWVQINNLNAPTAALFRYSGQLGVSGGLDADQEELLEFIRFQSGGCVQITGSSMLCDQLQDLGRPRHVHAMARQGGPFDDDFPEITESPNLADVFDLLCQADPGFEESASRSLWHVHTSHLLRHGLGCNVGIMLDGKLVSTGGIYNAGASHAVIGGLATLEGYRDRGYGGLICRLLSNRAMEQKKRPALYAATERLTVYYESMGFKITGRWCQLQLDRLEAGRNARS